jgi:predicted small metal-binding protein
MKTLSFCREAGFNCDYIVKGETDEEILMNSQQHAMSAHGMKVETFTTQYKDKLKGLIKDTDVKL